MKKAIFFVYFICLVVSGLSAQNWDINTLHRVNSWDGKFVRNYNKIISRSEPYVAVGVPVAMAVAAWIKHCPVSFIQRLTKSRCCRISTT